MKGKSLLLLLTAAGTLLLAGCQKTGIGSAAKGAVKFTASSYSAATKTDYGAMNGTETWQSIDWVDGDILRITSPQASHRYDENRHYADYMVNSAVAGTSPGKTGNPSKARLHNAGIADPQNDPGVPNPADHVDDNVNGLVWNDAVSSYDFYGIYPSPSVNADVVFPTTATSTQYDVATLTMPASQAYTPNAQAPTVLDPDMQYGYLGASVVASANQEVEMVFKPMFTAFQFTFDCESDAVVLREFSLKSASKALNGEYTATMAAQTDSWNSSISYSFAATNAGGVSIVFGDAGLTVTKGSPVTFTLFTLPMDYDDLSVVVRVSEVGNVAVKTNTLALKTNATSTAPAAFIPFEACKKHIIKGLVNPEFTRLIEVNSMVIDWKDQGQTTITVIP